jgi:ATP-binding cassette subfamily B protein
VTDLPAGPRHARPSDGWAARRAANRRAAGGDTASEKGQDPRAATGRDGEPALSGRGGRGSGAMTIDPRDRAQLADAPVPMSRVLALFRPHRGTGGRRRARSSSRRASSPWPSRSSCAPIVDVALPTAATFRLLALAGRQAWSPSRPITQLLGVAPDVAVDPGRSARHARAADPRVHPPAAPVARLLHPHPRRGGAVAPDQRRQRHAERRHDSTATSIAANLTTADRHVRWRWSRSRGAWRCSRFSSSRRPSG